MENGYRNLFRGVLWRVLPVDIKAKREISRDRKVWKKGKSDPERHLKETGSWLCRAQDACEGGGVARGYKVAKYWGYGPPGWQPAYPETTGYIIPTFFALSRFLKDKSYRARALRMADWEIAIQMESGAVMGGVVGLSPSPAVFNTGQVIFGWMAAYRETGHLKYLEAASKAGDYLVRVQERDGVWRKGNSRYAKAETTTYNARAAWSLIALGLEKKDDRYVDAGRRNIEAVLSKQRENGWFEDNCLSDPQKPLLHTIVYATRGVLEAGILLQEKMFVNAALKTLRALTSCQRRDGGIPGRLSSSWAPEAKWDCVTGNAQAAIAWFRAEKITGDSLFGEAARSAVDFVKETQNLESNDPAIRGGVKGSYPFDGQYAPFELINWAAKFTCDALLLSMDSLLAVEGIKG